MPKKPPEKWDATKKPFAAHVEVKENLKAIYGVIEN